jgi:flagellar motor switch protein FliN/FliY
MAESPSTSPDPTATPDPDPKSAEANPLGADFAMQSPEEVTAVLDGIEKDIAAVAAAVSGAPVNSATPATSDGGAPESHSAADPAEQAAIDELLKQASFEDPSTATAGLPAPDAEPFKLPNFQQVMADAAVSSIDLLRDVELNVKIELGRSRMLVEDVLKLTEGSVVELDKLAGDPVDVFVNDRLVARGEVLVLNDNFCVRVNEIVAGTKEEGL